MLTYKQKRNIINLTYQTQADNIVGKMTMSSLDSEMLKQEAVPRTRIQIKPTSYSRVGPPRSHALLALLQGHQPMALNAAAGSVATGAPNILPGPSILTSPSILPNVVLEMRRNSVGSFVVVGGSPGEVVIGDPAIAKIAPDAPVPPGDRVAVLVDPQPFKIFSGKTLGRTTLTASCFGSTASLDVVVKTFFGPPQFHPGVDHGHTPSGRWADVQANPNNAPGVHGFLLEKACRIMGPQGLVNTARSLMFSDKPIRLKHLDWYLSDGNGRDFVEDANIKDWLTRDSGIKRRLKHEIFYKGHGKPKAEGHFFFAQGEYAVEDFRFAFGAIDRVDFEVDFSQDTVRVWFQDRYEWHPVYPFYTRLSGDEVRETNCLHAAMVELKASEAADFWMKGQAEVALAQVAMA